MRVTCVLVMGLLTLYGLLITTQIGRDFEADWWVRDVEVYKDYRADTIDRPKILVAAGSNALFGIDSAILESRLGYPVANISTHAALDVSYLFRKVIKHMRQGDIVVLPLHADFYGETQISDWFANNMLAWGHESYLADLSVFSFIRFLVAVPKTMIAERLYKAGPHRVLLPPERIIYRVNQMAATNNSGWKGKYSYESLNRYGEFRIDFGPMDKLLSDYQEGLVYIDPDMVVSQRFLSYYRELEELARQRQVTIIFTWPVSIRNHLYNLSEMKGQRLAMNFRNKLLEHGIEIHCNPALFQMQVLLFVDTRYHTQTTGANIRTVNLADCIQALLTSDEQAEVDFSTAIERVRKQTHELLRTDQNWSKPKLR